MTSTNVDETIRFLLTAMPEFSIRGEGGGEKEQRWVHVGTDDSTYALKTVEPLWGRISHISPWNEPHGIRCR